MTPPSKSGRHAHANHLGAPNQDARNDSPSPAESEEPSSPKLSIVHLLAWMCGSALMLALFRNLEWSVSDWTPTRRVLAYAYHGLVYGAGLCGLFLPIVRFWTGAAPFPRQPGHWLLVTNGVIAVIFCVTHGLELLPLSRRELLALNAVGMLVPAVCYLWSALSARPRSTRWTVVLTVLSGLHLVQACGMLSLSTFSNIPTAWMAAIDEVLQMTQTWGVPLVGFMLIVTLLGDATSSTRRDWLHWVGALVELATICWIAGEQLPLL